jgi:hypothetical protein
MDLAGDLTGKAPGSGGAFRRLHFYPVFHAGFTAE